MEYLALITCLAVVFLIAMYTSLSELHSKVDILLKQNDKIWDSYLTDEIKEYLKNGNKAKAAGLLRQETGLSLKYCVSVIESLNLSNT